MSISNYKEETIPARVGWSGGSFKITAGFEEESTDTGNNTSRIKCTGQLIMTGTHWETTHNSTLTVYWHDDLENYDRQVASITFAGTTNYSTKKAEGTVNVTHKSDGTLNGYAYTKFIKGNTTAQNVPADSGIRTDTTALTTIPRASQPSINTWPNNSPDFNIGDTIVIHMNRKSDFTHKVYFLYGNTSVLVAENVVNYCEFDTSTVANDLYSLAWNTSSYSNNILVETYNGNTKIGEKTCPYNAIVTNAKPIFENFTFADVNPTTLALTGDSQKCIKGYSNIEATISTQNKATPVKGAQMVKYKYSIGDVSTEIAYSDNASVSGTINNASNGTYNIYAIDSRNNSQLVTKLATSEISYNEIYINKQTSSLERNNNGVGDGALLTLNGTIWNGNFGSVSNDITSATYRLKKSNSSTWITGTTSIVPTLSGDSFSFTGLIASDNLDTSWDLDASYDVELTLSDELSSTTISFVLNSAIPTISLDRDGVGIMCAYDSSLGGLLQVGGEVIDPTFKKPEITIDGSPVKTGRIIDGKEEYILYKYLGYCPNNAMVKIVVNTLKISDIEFVSGVGGTGYRATDGNWFMFNASRLAMTDNICINGSVSDNLTYFAFWLQTGTDRTNVKGWGWVTFTYKD